ncbi:MAG: hypothetical protein ABJK25_12370 [Halieaceae bacterium]
MTEYEMTDVIMSRFGHMTDQASLYFALVSGYLVTAYFVGSRLTTLQVTVINSLYCLWVGGILGGYISTVGDTVKLESAIRGVYSTQSAVVLGDSTYAYTFAVVQAFGLVASLVFMWSVRHPRTKGAVKK